MISQNITVGVFFKSSGLCAIIDSHQHVNSKGGGMITMANDPKKAITESIACSESHSGSGDPKLSEIYSVIIPTVKEIQVQNQ